MDDDPCVDLDVCFIVVENYRFDRLVSPTATHLTCHELTKTQPPFTFKTDRHTVDAMCSALVLSFTAFLVVR